jgi:allophanate hydrolase subunit 1
VPRRSTHAEHADAAHDSLHIYPAGDHALLVRLGAEQISPRVNAQVLALLAALDAASPRGVIDCIPAYASLLVTFDPLVTDRARVRETILEAWRAGRWAHRLPAQKVVHVPVRYGGAAGIDLERAGRHTTPSRSAMAARSRRSEATARTRQAQAGAGVVTTTPSQCRKRLTLNRT